MRLIDADALWEIIRTWQARLKPEHFITDRVKSDALNTVIAIIESQTTIEAEPVRHGRWIDGMPYTGSHWKVCSKCHKSADHPAGGHEYCGHCGTKMDGKDIDVPGKICPATKLPCCDCVPETPCAKMYGGEDTNVLPK